MRANPRLRVFADRADRQQAKGKPPKVVSVAVLRKLLLLAWTRLRTGHPFSPSEPTASRDQVAPTSGARHAPSSMATAHSTGSSSKRSHR